MYEEITVCTKILFLISAVFMPIAFYEIARVSRRYEFMLQRATNWHLLVASGVIYGIGTAFFTYTYKMPAPDVACTFTFSFFFFVSALLFFLGVSKLREEIRTGRVVA